MQNFMVHRIRILPWRSLLLKDEVDLHSSIIQKYELCARGEAAEGRALERFLRAFIEQPAASGVKTLPNNTSWKLFWRRTS